MRIAMIGTGYVGLVSGACFADFGPSVPCIGKDAVARADAVFIAVGTPPRRGDGHADLSYVHAAAREIAENLKGFTVVITKSTVPVGTGDGVERVFAETNPEAEV